MCTDSMLLEDEFDEDIIKKYNDESQQERIEYSMTEIIDQLEKLYFID